MDFGVKIKKLRMEKKLSMRDFGEKLGITHSHVSKLESGKNSPSVDLLQKIADSYNVDMSYFFIEESDLDIFNNTERDLLLEKNLNYDTIREKYDFVVDGEPASEEEVQKVIEYIRFLRHQKRS